MKPILGKLTDFFCLILMLLGIGFVLTKILVSVATIDDTTPRAAPIGTEYNPVYIREVEK